MINIIEEVDIKDFYTSYRDDYKSFLVQYKANLEPKLVLIAATLGQNFFHSESPRFEYDDMSLGLCPPALYAVDDFGNKLLFNPELIDLSWQDVLNLCDTQKLWQVENKTNTSLPNLAKINIAREDKDIPNYTAWKIR